MEEVFETLSSIWDSNQLTNGGPLHQQLESELCQILELSNLSLCNNGTLALILALQSQNITGEVITTPYSFAATRNVLSYVGCSAKFVDVEPSSWNIDPNQVDKAISKNTKAILGVHCYGNPCNDSALREIANERNIPIIYDAAHAFGVRLRDKSVLSFGDASSVSFHATKVFNTFEGGMVVVNSSHEKNLVDQLKNFGISPDSTNINIARGLNAKMSELNAAVGLCQLKYIKSVFQRRREIDNYYREQLKDLEGISLYQYDPESDPNYSYFPILVTDQYPQDRDELCEKLKSKGVFARKYFYPLLHASERPGKEFLKRNFPVANRVANQVLCLPIFPDLTLQQVEYICDVICHP
ncbi:DegT/DnrJ/EryC1/StrS family aminotransferase [Gammaproteobacteria bacterium]|nr:DegT/DnrJ/EryC1/StrS family aminotransferase [Gammaproteobacteria bacterium]